MAEIDAHPKTTIAPGFRALLAKVIDYAGVFPPASLPLAEAIANYDSYLRSPEAWMLARFIIPARRLQELDAHEHLFGSGSTYRFSVLPSAADNGEDFLATFESDLANVQQFQRKHPVTVDQLEFRLPREFLDTDVVHVRRFLSAVEQLLLKFDQEHLDIFLEIPLDEFLRQTLPILTGAITVFNRDRTSPDLGCAGLKMRTGGTEADAFPAVDHVAYVITACCAAAVPLKATAGLHHPLRHHDDALQTPMHGFLNVFCAAALTFANDLDEAATAGILRDEEPSHFVFTEEGLEWMQLSASLKSIERVRNARALSFGSCSFDEPVSDLRALGHL